MRLLIIASLVARFAAAQISCPKCVLAEAKQLSSSGGDREKTVSLLKTAAAQFQIVDKDDAAHAEALELLAMYVRGTYRADLERWKSEVGPGIEQALKICEAQPNIDPNTLASALELKADVMGRNEAGSPFWARAQKIRATQLEGEPSTQTQLSPGPPVQLKGNVTAPLLKEKVDPEYPLLARYAALECSRELIRIIIDTSGAAKQIHIVKGCGYGFDEKAVEAVEKWKFSPALLNGSAVEIRSNVEVNFRLLNNGISASASASEKSPGSSTQSEQLVKKGLDALKRGDLDEAQSDLEACIKLDPKNKFAWNDLGLVYLGRHQADKAKAAFQQQIDINAKDPWAYNNLGRALNAQGHLSEAESAFRKQLEINPNDKFAHLNLARALVVQAKWDEALQEAQKATEVADSNAESWITLARAQAHAGKSDEARKSFNKAFAVNDSTVTQNDLAYAMAQAGIHLERAWQLASSALVVDAGRLCTPEQTGANQECVTKLGRFAALLDTAGWVRLQQGNTDEAKLYLESAYGLAPHSATALHLAGLYARQGAQDAAVRFYAISQLSLIIDVPESERVKAQLGHDLQRQLQAIPKNEVAEGCVTSAAGWDADFAADPMKLHVLVDPSGKVLEAKPESTPALTPAQLGQVQKLQLLPLAWPDHALKSWRTLEIRPGGNVCHVISYVQIPVYRSTGGEISRAGQRQ